MKVEEQPVHTPSSEADVWTWIIFAGLLVLGVLIGLGGLVLTHMNQQMQQATGSQSVPSSK